MSYNALFIGWEGVNTGREDEAAQLANEVEKLLKSKAGNVQSVHLVPNGTGSLSGFYLATGDRAKIDDLSASEEFTKLATRLAIVGRGLQITRGYTGAEAQAALSRFKSVAAE